MPLFKEKYRGRGLWWHGGNKYGDETNVYAASLKEARSKIDRQCALDDAARPAHEKYWDTVAPNDREKWRKLCQTSELSASELAWSNRPTITNKQED